MFISETCPYCRQALSALETAGYSPKVVVPSSSQRAALSAVTSSSSVPNVWVKGKYVGGCNDGPESWMGIKKLINNGQLRTMLAA